MRIQLYPTERVPRCFYGGLQGTPYPAWVSDDPKGTFPIPPAFWCVCAASLCWRPHVSRAALSKHKAEAGAKGRVEGIYLLQLHGEFWAIPKNAEWTSVERWWKKRTLQISTFQGIVKPIPLILPMRGEVSFLGKHLKDTSGLRQEPQSVET